jgi:hypothetical protein
MLEEVKFTSARSSLSDLFDQVWHRFLPAVVKRHQAEEVLLVRRDLQEDILRAYAFKPEVLHEEDGSVTLAIDELELAVNAPTLEEAIQELIREIKIYAEDYKDRIQLFLHAPNRRGHFPYVLRVWLCDSDEEIRSLLEV